MLHTDVGCLVVYEPSQILENFINLNHLSLDSTNFNVSLSNLGILELSVGLQPHIRLLLLWIAQQLGPVIVVPSAAAQVSRIIWHVNSDRNREIFHPFCCRWSELFELGVEIFKVYAQLLNLSFFLLCRCECSVQKKRTEEEAASPCKLLIEVCTCLTKLVVALIFNCLWGGKSSSSEEYKESSYNVSLSLALSCAPPSDFVMVEIWLKFAVICLISSVTCWRPLWNSSSPPNALPLVGGGAPKGLVLWYPWLVDEPQSEKLMFNKFRKGLFTVNTYYTCCSTFKEWEKVNLWGQGIKENPNILGIPRSAKRFLFLPVCYEMFTKVCINILFTEQRSTCERVKINSLKCPRLTKNLQLFLPLIS